MIKMNILKKMIEYVMWTAYVHDEKPVSLLIISKPESGKTEIITVFEKNEGIVYINDVTPWGMVKELYKYQELGKKVNHVFIPDLLSILMKGNISANAMIQFLNSATEEGLTKIHTYGIQIDLDKPLQFGIVTAITTDIFKKRKKRWIEIGFLSRMIPFSYKYPISTVNQIMENIFHTSWGEKTEKKIQFPKNKVKVLLSPELAKEVYLYTVRLASSQKTYGFRIQRQFQTLMKAIALSKKRTEVIREDVEELKKLLEFTNLEFNEIM